jgi:hypothetical protein
MDWWNAIIHYYKAIGEKFHVNPVIFVGIHIVATPVFALAAWWIVASKRKNKPLTIPIFVAVLVFNAANLYLVIFGKSIPFWIYAFVGSTTLLSGYFTAKRIRKKMLAR